VSLTWLHISDFHVKSGDSYDRDVVLRALVRAVHEYSKTGLHPDLIFATGDIAHSGKPDEYTAAGNFFIDLLATTQLERKRLFVIPGNHDVDRKSGDFLKRTLDTREEADAYFDPRRAKPHQEKLRAFLDWHNLFFDGIRKAPVYSTCGPVELVDLKGHRVGILPMNSALFCQGEDDHNKLWVGRRCLDDAVTELDALHPDL
jgi:hypothetical protein